MKPIILFGVFVQYGPGTAANVRGSAVYLSKYLDATPEEEAAAAQVFSDDFSERYPLFQDIHVMIFIGFGYLMTFLRKYGYTALDFTFMIGAFEMQWHILNEDFWHAVFFGKFKYIELNIGDFMRADFSAGAVLFTFGALISKTSPTQMLVVAIIEVIMYNVNENIGLRLGISDVGGSYVIHMFGAYFGLACSWVLSLRSASGRSDNAAVYHSKIFLQRPLRHDWYNLLVDVLAVLQRRLSVRHPRAARRRQHSSLHERLLRRCIFVEQVLASG